MKFNFKMLILLFLLVAASPAATSNLSNLKEKAISNYVYKLKKLNRNELETLLAIYQHSLDYKTEYIFTAIAWKESHFNKYPINAFDNSWGSYGPFHISLYYSAKRHKLRKKFDINVLASKLLNSIKFSVKEVNLVINQFKTKGCATRCLLARYNGGWGGNKRKVSLAYADDVMIRAKAIEKYINSSEFLLKIIKTN